MSTEIEMTTATAGATEPVETPNPQGEKQEISHDYPKSIFRAPFIFRYNRAFDFEPKLVSIGPYFRGRESLRWMEKVKYEYMFDLMQKRSVGASNVARPDKGKKIWCYSDDEVPITHFYPWESYARGFYKERVEYTRDEFILMLVVDSCFIIRIILAISQEVKGSMSFLDVNVKTVRSDLLLLENQIPLFFIKEVYNWFLSLMEPSLRFPPFETILGPFICLDMPWKFDYRKIDDAADHLLHLYWNCSMPEKASQGSEQQPVWGEILRSSSAPKRIPNACELHKVAGVNFENIKKNINEMSNNFSIKEVKGLDVEFRNGILQMPCLKIDPIWITLTVNLLAFEHSMFPPDKQIFTSYMSFMDSLIDSEKDVELLQKSGVIHNTLSDHKMAATFFNVIGSNCITDHRNHFLRENLVLMLHKYYNSSWNRAWASLRHNYFGNPWAGIGVVAGATLLILSVLQTVYTILGYYHQQH